MKLKIIFITLCALFVMTSCMSEKDRYLKEYKTFATNLIEQSETYTETDWEAVQKRYAELRDNYSKYMSDMTQEERQTINELNGKINAAIIKQGFSGAASQIESLFNEATTTIEELLK